MSQLTPILNVENVSLFFGGNAALAEVSFDVRRGEIRAIIGPNGAGKTSILNCISGFYRPQRGRILFKGEADLTKTPTDQIARLGLARTFQNIALYTGLSTLNNLMAARHIHMRQGALASMLYWGPARREEVRHREVVEDIIDFLEIAHIRKAVVGALPYGLRKRVELGRALAMEPELLLLDEPTAGLDPDRSEAFVKLIRQLHGELGLTVVLVTHDLDTLAALSARVAVLAERRILAYGPLDEIMQIDYPFINGFFGAQRSRIALERGRAVP